MTSKLKQAWAIWFAILISLYFSLAFAESPAALGYAESKFDPSLVEYNTELFNLLSNKKNIIDKKNYYIKEFASMFDSTLRQSQNAKTKQDTATLKKRLLSGPASKPRLYRDNNTSKQYIYYDACQAHACDETKLGLLYEIDSKQMLARLTVHGQVEYLGKIPAPERRLLDLLQSDNARR